MMMAKQMKTKTKYAQKKVISCIRWPLTFQPTQRQLLMELRDILHSVRPFGYCVSSTDLRAEKI